MRNARELIYYSSKAPSGHNSQPWKFKIQGNSIEIHPDFDLALPIVDPTHRELYISLGCATENICVASSHFGYESDWKIQQDPKGINYIITEFKESKKKKKGIPIEYLEKRQTNRSLYDGSRINSGILTKLKKLPSQENISVYYFQNGGAYFQTIKNAILKGNEIQMNDPEFKNELLSWIRFNKKEVNHLQNGLTYKVMGAPPTPKFLGKAMVKSFLTPKRQNRSDIKKIDSSSHFILLTTKTDTVEEWIKLGMVLQRLLLKLTELGIASAYLNQPCELKSLSTELQGKLPIHNEYPTIILRIGYAKEVPFSPRKDVEKIIS